MRRSASRCVNTLRLLRLQDVLLAAVVPPGGMSSSLWYEDFWAISASSRVPLSTSVNMCICVCCCCYSFDGTGVVDLQDVLLLDGQCFGMIDSQLSRSADFFDGEFAKAS